MPTYRLPGFQFCLDNSQNLTRENNETEASFAIMDRCSVEAEILIALLHYSFFDIDIQDFHNKRAIFENYISKIFKFPNSYFAENLLSLMFSDKFYLVKIFARMFDCLCQTASIECDLFACTNPKCWSEYCSPVSEVTTYSMDRPSFLQQQLAVRNMSSGILFLHFLCLLFVVRECGGRIANNFSLERIDRIMPDFRRFPPNADVDTRSTPAVTLAVDTQTSTKEEKTSTTPKPQETTTTKVSPTDPKLNSFEKTRHSLSSEYYLKALHKGCKCKAKILKKRKTGLKSPRRRRKYWKSRRFVYLEKHVEYEYTVLTCVCPKNIRNL